MLVRGAAIYLINKYLGIIEAATSSTSSKKKAPASSTPSCPKRRSVEVTAYDNAAAKFASLEDLKRSVAEGQAETLASFLPVFQRMEASQAASAAGAVASATALQRIAAALEKLVAATVENAKT